LFSGPQGQPTVNIQDVNDLATLGRNAVVPIDRAGLTNTAGNVFAIKWILDRLSDVGGGAGAILGGRSLASAMESPTWVDAISGQHIPFLNSLYSGTPAVLQNVLQYQNNPPSTYDPLGWNVTQSQNPP
jgi:hypothetical protein